MKLMESSIPQNLADKLAPLGLEWPTVQTEPFVQVLFTAMSDFLGIAKSKENKVALIVSKPGSDEFLMAGIVSYFPGTTEEEAGNWDYRLTFDKEDIKDCKILTADSVQFINIMGTTAKRLVNADLMAMYIPSLIINTVESLIQWLDNNAKETEKESLEVPGYFIASVAVEEGEKVTSITPDGAMKRLIKGDAAVAANY